MLSLFYLSYLAMTTQAIVFNDGWAYENDGKILAEGKWQNYFINGPNREPLYPLLVSVAMRLSNIMNVPYLNALIPIQILCLVLAQLLMTNILKKLKITDRLIAAIVLFMGFSPALVNSSLILYSEILTYPLILWNVLTISNAWKNITRITIQQAMLMGMTAGCSFALMTLTKASFEVITALAFLPFLALCIQSAIRKNKRLCIHILAFLLTFAVAYQLPIVAIKTLNKKFNGNFVVTNRSASILYTSTVRLTEVSFNTDHLLAVASTIPGPEFCNAFRLKECYRWGVNYFDKSFEWTMKDVAGQGLSKEEISPIYMNLIAQKIVQNPIQYALFSGLEGLKLLFWEGTQTAYVTYPDAVERFYNAGGLQHLLRFTVAILNTIALMAIFFFLLKKRKSLYDPLQCSDKISLLFWVTFLIVTYMLIMSRFYLTARYGLVIAPLLLIVTAWFLDHSFKNKKAQAS